MRRNEQSKRGAPALPNVPRERLQFVELRALPAAPGTEPECFAFLADSGEWAVSNHADAATIRAALPGAAVRVFARTKARR